MGLVTVECAIGVFRSFAGDVITSQLQTYGAHTRPELAMLLAFVRAGDDVVDVGSHIGTFAIPIARKGARVTAIEPQASAFRLLQENAKLNGVELDARQVAIGTGGALTIDEVPGNSGAGFLTPGGAIGTTALDGLVGRADVLKVDVEGMELEVLRSARRLIARDRPVIYLEIHATQLRRYGASTAMAERFLLDLNYRFFVNVGPRNAAHDGYRLARLPTLRLLSGLHDVLAIHNDSDRLPQSSSSPWLRLATWWLRETPPRLAGYALQRFRARPHPPSSDPRSESA
jgi:FkbM family methyltransferase